MTEVGTGPTGMGPTGTGPTGTTMGTMTTGMTGMGIAGMSLTATNPQGQNLAASTAIGGVGAGQRQSDCAGAGGAKPS